MGDFKLYDKTFAEISQTGWYEAYRSGPREWIILECFSDGTASKRTFEERKSLARATVKMLNERQGNELPYYIDHGIKYYHKVI